MIVVRDVFNLKYGKARDAKAAWKEMSEIMKASDPDRVQPRVLTDLTGQAYRMVMETEFPSLTEYEKEMGKVFSNEQWRAAYQKFTPLVESGHREIFSVVE